IYTPSLNCVPSLEKRASLRIQAAAVPTTWEYEEAQDHVDRLFPTTYFLGPRHATGNGGLPRRAGGHGYPSVTAPAARQGPGCLSHDCPTPLRSTCTEVRQPHTRSAAHAGGLSNPRGLCRRQRRSSRPPGSAVPNAGGCLARWRAALGQRFDAEPLPSCL